MTSPRSLAVPTWQQLLEQQDLVLSRIQALQTGLGEEGWSWRIARGRWQRIVPGVAVAHSGPVTDRQRAWAAVLHAGRGAALTGDAALVEHGVELPRPAAVDVAVPHERRVRGALLRTGDGSDVLRILRTRGLGPLTHPVRTPPVVRPAPAVLQAVDLAPTDRAGEWRLAAAVQQRCVRVPDLRRALEQLPGLSRAALVRTVLDDVELGAHASSELDFLRFLRQHALPMPDRLQLPVRSGTVRYLDAWWERQRVAAEVDGAHHRSVAAWQADVLRGNDVALAARDDGVLLLRFTAGSLRHEGDRAAAQLRAVL